MGSLAQVSPVQAAQDPVGFHSLCRQCLRVACLLETCAIDVPSARVAAQSRPMTDRICLLAKTTIEGTDPADDNLLHDRLAAAVGNLCVMSTRTSDGLYVEIETTFGGGDRGIDIDTLVAHDAELRRRFDKVLATVPCNGHVTTNWKSSSLRVLATVAV